MPNRFVFAFVVLLLALVSPGLRSQSLNYKETILRMNEFAKSAVFIQTPLKYGTGTLFMVPFTDTSTVGSAYIATAKHVLDRIDSLNRVVGSFDTVSVYFNRNTGSKESRRYCVMYRSNLLDIAVLGPIEFKRSFSEYATLSPSLSDIADYPDIKKGQMAFVAGYPFAIGSDGQNLDPVVQSGIVAHFDSSKSVVLIDIPINLGNSGCPVYIITVEGAPKLLGLVFQYEPSREDIVMRPAIKAPVPANTSLGRVVLLRRIMSDLKSLRN